MAASMLHLGKFMNPGTTLAREIAKCRSGSSLTPITVDYVTTCVLQTIARIGSYIVGRLSLRARRTLTTSIRLGPYQI